MGMGIIFLQGEENITTLLEPLDTSKVFSFPLHFWIVFFSHQVNMAKSSGYFYANIIFTVITIVINSWAGKIILGKERTRIHDLIVFDCFVNILSSLNTAFIQSPWFVLR